MFCTWGPAVLPVRMCGTVMPAGGTCRSAVPSGCLSNRSTWINCWRGTCSSTVRQHSAAVQLVRQVNLDKQPMQHLQRYLHTQGHQGCNLHHATTVLTVSPVRRDLWTDIVYVGIQLLYMFHVHDSSRCALPFIPDEQPEPANSKNMLKL